MNTLTRFILIVLVIALVVLVILPFFLNIAGVTLFGFGVPRAGLFGGGGKETLLISKNGGSWAAATFVRDSGIEAPAHFLDISFHPALPEVIFLGTQGNGLWESVDGGATWRKTIDQKNVLLSSSDVYRTIAAPSRPETIYAAVYQNNRGMLLKSEDNGKSFRQVYFVSLDRYGVFDCFVDPHDAEHVYIATGQGGVLETRDGGATWNARQWLGEPLMRLMVNPLDLTQMYVITQRGIILKSVDGGAHWTDLLAGFGRGPILPAGSANRRLPPSPLTFTFGNFGNTRVTYFLPDINSFSTLYMIRGGSLWRSRNAGDAWEEVNTIVPPAAGALSAFTVYPGQPDLLFASVQNQIYRSTDGGNNWSMSAIPATGTITRLLIPARDPGTMIAIIQ